VVWRRLEWLTLDHHRMTDRISVLADQVRALHQELDDDIQAFQAATGLHCRFGCGRCCLKPDIEATPLEFLPLAVELYREGKAEAWLESLATNGPVCQIFNADQAGAGKCTRYSDRGMICRLFGYSARRNKYGAKEIITCTIIKDEQAVAYSEASEKVAEGMAVPLAANYYSRLRGIDPALGSVPLPINKAIARALEMVLDFYYYQSQQS